MKAEFRINGQVASQTTQSFTLGSEVKQSNQYYKPADSAWVGGEDNDITVGEFNAIGIDLQGIGATQLKSLQTRLEATKAKLNQFQQNTSDTTPLIGLTKEDLTGDIVQTGIIGYFAQVDTSDKLSARTAKTVVSYRLPSYGRFLTAAQTHYWYGIAKKVSFPGVVMDVDYLFQQLEAKDATNPTRINYMRQLGTTASAAEHAVPELMFADHSKLLSDPSQPQGVSAVKALAIAASQGQKIYTLTPVNQAIHSSVVSGLQISADVKNEITNALSAGKEVTVHEKDITVNGWTGCGYIIIDQDTGAGAYKISGGANGGSLSSGNVSAMVFNMLGLGYIAPTALELSSAITKSINAVTFAKTYLEGIFECYREEIINSIAIIALAIAVGFLIGSISGGLGAAPAFLVILSVLAPQAASAAQNKGCELECSKATKSQLVNAIPIPILDAEEFKIDEGFGQPTSPYDICACKDGSLIIYGVNACGRIKPDIDFHITDRRWKL